MVSSSWNLFRNVLLNFFRYFFNFQNSKIYLSTRIHVIFLKSRLGICVRNRHQKCILFSSNNLAKGLPCNLPCNNTRN